MTKDLDAIYSKGLDEDYLINFDRVREQFIGARFYHYKDTGTVYVITDVVLLKTMDKDNKLSNVISLVYESDVTNLKFCRPLHEFFSYIPIGANGEIRRFTQII